MVDCHLIWASTPTPVGLHRLNKMDGPPLEGLCVIHFLIWLSRKPALRYICLSIRVLTEISPVHHTAQLLICSPVPAVCAALDSLTRCDQQPVGPSSFANVHSGDSAQRICTSFTSVTKLLTRPKCGILPVCLNNDATLIGSMVLCLGSGE